MHLVERIRLRLDPESDHEMGRVGSQVGSGSGCRGGRERCAGRGRDGEGVSGSIKANILAVRIRLDEVMHAALQLARGRWAERIFVVLGQVLGGNFGVSIFFVSELNADPFRNESRFGSGRGTGLGFTGSLGLPLQDRFPI
jgi:hypothetical protein